MKSLKLTLSMLAAMAALTACGDDSVRSAPYQQPQVVAAPAAPAAAPVIVNNQVPPQQGVDGGDVLLGAAVGAAAGYMAGKSTTPAAAPVYVTPGRYYAPPRDRVIIKKTVIIKEVEKSPTPSRSKYFASTAKFKK